MSLLSMSTVCIPQCFLLPQQQRQHPKGVEEDFDPYCSNNTTVRDNPHPRHSRPQSSMDILHQRLGVTEVCTVCMYIRMQRSKHSLTYVHTYVFCFLVM